MTKIRGFQTNMMAIRESRKSQKELERSSRKLASGSRIVSASDDAAGQSSAVSSEVKKRGKIQASRNANDAISMLQVMEGGMQEMYDMIIRVRELAVQAASDSVSDTERSMLDLEVGALIREVNRMAQTSSFMDQKLLVGDQRKLKIQIDDNSSKNDTVYIDLKDMAQTPYALGISDVKISSKHQAKLSFVKLDYAINSITESRAKVGGTLSRLSSSTNKLANDVYQESKIKSQNTDLDYASETAKHTSSKIQAEASKSVMAQNLGSGMDYIKLIG